MGLMICPDCLKDVSTIAMACPHCGRPVQTNLLEKFDIKPIYLNYVVLAACLLTVGMMIYIIYSGLPRFFLMIPGVALVGIGLIFLAYRLVAKK